MFARMSEARRALRVHLLRHQPRGVNPGYEAFDRALSYELTQEVIIPKMGLMDYAARRVVAPWGNDIHRRVLDVGSGPGWFFESLVEARPRPLGMLYVAVDLSLAMAARATDVFSRLLEGWSRDTGDIEIRAYGGVNALAIHSSDMQGVCDNGAFDLIVASQFEQYCPNDCRSLLGEELSLAAVPFVTKGEFRRFLRSLLAPRGKYVTIQDYSETGAARERDSLALWDSCVASALHQFTLTTPDLVNMPRLQRKLIVNYGADTTHETRIQAVTSARVHRRRLCREEVESWNEALTDIEAVFGKQNVTVVEHPIPALSRFRLVIAERT
jgi:SAM-dependent methyltransferase